ncbi:MAG: hypothetical protein JXD23_05100 [Spirochaetales bacterium]|nr:hypothetical protein [Spirochaetales bacterium]
MNGRGTRLFFFSVALTFGLVTAATGYSRPVLGAGAPVRDAPRSVTLNRLCQKEPGKDVDYSRYFTVPDRDGGTVYVFYNNIIDADDNTQFGYALLYGLEFAAEKANANDYIAVGIYFSNRKGEIYGIQKQAFDEFRRKKMEIKDLLKYLSVKKVDLSDLPGTKPKVQ